jgi:O-methyltransferase
VSAMRSSIARKVLELIYRDRRYPSPEMVVMKHQRVRMFDFRDYDDYVRASTLELLSHEIYLRNVPGACAELGVYRGEFARLMNTLFIDRKLYLFDTFSGFDPQDLEYERRFGFRNPSKDFKDTDVQTVMSAMPHPENCVVKSGHFPRTAEGIDEIFCLVSVDVDLFTPTLEGLRYFYPRLAPGGFLMVHDYNNHRNYPGPRAAVEQFCTKDGSIPFVPLCDLYGSVVLGK